MKKIFLSLFFLGFVCFAFAQNVEMNKSEALAMVQKSATELGFRPGQINDLVVAQSYGNPSAGIEYIYLQQTYEGIPVHNRIMVLAYKNGKLVSRAGEFYSLPPSSGTPANPAVSAINAVQAAAAYVKAKNPDPSAATFITSAEEINFGKLGIAYEDVKARQYWLPFTKNGKTSLVRVWQILLAPVNTDDMWQIRVDAQTNTALEKNNLTVYDQFDQPKNKTAAVIDNKSLFMPAQAAGADSRPTLVGTVNYLVVPYPVESPLYGPATLVTNPWTMTGAFNANATTLKWHNDGTLDYTITRGNNVWATEDRIAANQNTGLPATSTTTPDPLNFNFPPDYTVAPTTAAFQQYAITNLFYWNNIMHDLSYDYTFDEVSGNFQASNLGRGGAGNDHVIALAQSGAGTNNANFSTPADGGRGRMRMYLFTAPTPDRDGDLDAGVMCHEYTHGISSRLTGGIAGGAGCLSNAEEGGEGWSDYFGLMATTDWSTALITDGFNKKRPIGNYVLAQTAAGAGIRTHPYCTNFAVNPLTYAFVASSGGEVHDIGEVWAETLWDMTWNIIQTDGINPNLFNAAGTGGNARAMRLVMEGMRLQPCSPGFIDGRDAILRADQLLYNGQYHCAILSAFAARGMGTDARQGSSSSTSDQTVGFSTVESSLTLNTNFIQQQEGLQVTYTNHVTAGACGSITNYIIRDTLPTNVTYVSGGTYTAATRVVSFTVNVPAGTTGNYAFTVQINAGSYFPTVTLFEDLVPGPTIPAATWTTSTTGASSWTVSTVRSHSPASSYFCAGVTTISDARLYSTNAVALGATPPNLSFWHWYNTESTYDGGILEISTDGGANYVYVPAANFIKNGYTTTMDASTVLAGKTAWSGSSGGFIKTIVNMVPYANQSIKLRFRNTNDNGTTGEGWYIDDIAIKNQATVDIRSTLFNASNVILQTADTLTVILPPSVTPAITLTSAAGTNTQSVCLNTALVNIVYATTNGVTGVTLTGALPAGVTGAYSGGTNGTYTISGTPTASGTFNYTLTTTGGTPAATASGTITVNTASTVTLTSGSNTQTVCQNTAIANIVYTVGNGATGATAGNLPAGVTGTYSGGTNGTYTISGTPTASGTFNYTVTTSGGCSPAATLSGTITVTAPGTVTLTSAAGTNNQSVNVNTPIANITYSTAGGITGAAVGGLPTGVTGVYNAGTITISGTPTIAGTFNYTITTTGGCGATATGTITVTTPSAPAITLTSAAGTNTQTVCRNTAIINITYSTANGVTGVTLTGALPAGVTGVYSGGSNGTYTISGTPTAAGTFNYTLTTSGGTGAAATATGTITVNAPPAAPTVTTPVTYCQGSTATPLTATGTNLLWYTTATGGTGSATAPTPSTATVGSTTYYVSSTVNGCEGPRAAIVVTVNVTPGAPTVTSPVNYCLGATAVPLTATGTNLLWYTTATGGTGSATAPTPSTATAGSTTYYVSQTTGSCEGPRAAIVVNVAAGAAITSQPSDITSCATTAVFTVVATGTNLSYQWQVSTDGGNTYSNIPGANSATLTLTGLTPLQSNYKYRVLVTAAGCGAVISNAVSAHIGVTPSVVLTAAPTTVYNPSHNGGLFTTVSPIGNYTYQWKRDGVILPVLGPQITAANGLLYDFGTYVVTVFDVASGCSGVSNAVTIVDDPNGRSHLFISPSPTTGPVQVSFYSTTTTAQTRGITVYDSKGAEVMVKNFTTSGRYAVMNINLGGQSAGVYMIILRDASGKRIASGEVIKF